MSEFNCPQLPLELWDAVLDNISDDQHTLATCKSVCRAWVPRSRYHLFREIHLCPATTDGFSDVLAACPAIGALVSSVTIDRFAPDACNSNSNNPERRATCAEIDWVDETLPELIDGNANRLPAVTSLRLHALTIDGLLFPLLCGAFPRVETLHISHCALQDTHALGQLCASFPHLRQLRVMNIRLQSAVCVSKALSTLPAPACTPRPLIQTLQFPARVANDASASQLMRWLMAESLHAQIGAIEVSDLRAADALALDGLLRRLGSTVHTLRLGLQPGCLGDRSSTRLSLASCTGLRTLGFNLTLHNPANARARLRPLDWVLVLLAQVNAPDLEHVCFTVGGDRPTLRSMAAVEWAQAAEILSSMRFRSLKQITFDIRLGAKSRRLGCSIRTRMKALEKRGIAVTYVHGAT